ncbi:MAG TPA: class I SAM-dependent methyltransferase [Streptosporangiaceae bacterium]|nr:class I SAM-dependent methyltransferase [Streptosporangiaceae bacterium]
MPQFVVFTCSRCGYGTTVYTQEIADNQARFEGERWTETRDMLESVQAAMARRRYEDVHPYQPGHELLEVGCGTGEFLSYAREAGHRVTGLDLSQRVAAHVSSRYPGIDVRCGTLDSVSFDCGFFDVVAAFHVLEHVTDPIALLSQMAELVRPGGLVYVRVPNLNTWYRRALGSSWWGFSLDHVGHFTESSLRLALSEAGLRIETLRSADSDPRYSLWPVLPLLYRRGCILRSVGSALQPSADRQAPARVRLSEGTRVAAKRQLLATYQAYRRAATLMLTPFSSLQLERGGGRELLAVGRKPV